MLATELREPRYWDSPDALNLCDFTPPETLGSADRLRLFLKKSPPGILLDKRGKEERA